MDDMFRRDADWMLQSLILALSNSEGIGPPLTLSMRGIIITGTLISESKYFKLLGNSIRNQDDTTNLFHDIAEKSSSIRKKTLKKNPVEEISKVNYFHLKDAHFILSYRSAIPYGEGILWRGKIKSIDGYYWGSLQSNYIEKF